MYTTISSGGTDLSGGQAQRLSIARALIKNADLILLDEPTAALDLKTEHELIDAFDELLNDKMSIIVTHRYAIIQNADYIYCLDECGRVIEHGTPKALYEAHGYYFSLCISQLSQ